MSLWTLHRIFIGTAILGCVAYAVFEGIHAREHATPRVLLGVGAPLAFAVVLGAYYASIARRR